MKFDSLYLYLASYFCFVCCIHYDPVKHATWGVYDVVNLVYYLPQRAITDSDKHKLLKVTEWKPNDPLGEFVPSTAKIICKFDPESGTDNVELILKACHEAGRRVAKVVSIRKDLIIFVRLAPTYHNTQTFASGAHSASIPLLDIDNEVRFFPQPLVKNMFFEWEYELLDAPFVECDGVIRLNPDLKWKNPNDFEFRIFNLMHEMVHILGFTTYWRETHLKPLIEEEVLAPDFVFPSVSKDEKLRFKFLGTWISSLEATRILSQNEGHDPAYWEDTKNRPPFPLQLASYLKTAIMKKGNAALNTNLAHGRDIPLYEDDLSHIDDIAADYLMYHIVRDDVTTNLPEKYPTGWIGPKVRAVLGAIGYGIAGLKGTGVISVQDDMKITPTCIKKWTTQTKELKDIIDDSLDNPPARWYPGSKLEVIENHFTPFNRCHRDHFCLKTIEHGIRKKNEEKTKEKN